MKYIVNDLEGGNFMEWTNMRPLTRKEIIECFRSMSDDVGQGFIPLKDFSLKMISEVWNVEILPIKI